VSAASLGLAAGDIGGELEADFERNFFNPCVGQALLSQNDRVRVWLIQLAPGERLAFHRHVLDYFWTAVTEGEAISHIDGGAATRSRYFAGETKHLSFAAGEFMVHDLHNTGDSELVFVTVEFLQSANQPLPLPAGVRRAAPPVMEVPSQALGHPS
jgi:beta-alanine degradation protein BauB